MLPEKLVPSGGRTFLGCTLYTGELQDASWDVVHQSSSGKIYGVQLS